MPTPPDHSVALVAGRRRAAWSMRLLLIVLALLTVEGLVRLAVQAEWLAVRIRDVEGNRSITYLGDIDPHVGVWHVRNTTVEVNTPNGPVTYETNEHGMRDRPRSFDSEAAERVVVLGDSFVEGMYVEEEDRLTDLMEARTGIEFLNFGTSGSFGSIQQWLLYRHLARRFDHSRVFLFMLPDNDFADNDPARHSPRRYRPYLRRAGDTYQVYYPVPFEAASDYVSAPVGIKRFRYRLLNRWWTMNVLHQLDLAAVRDRVRGRFLDASYDRFGEEDLRQLLFTYEQIHTLASPRPLTLFVIPRDRDFIAWEHGRLEGRVVNALQDFARGRDSLQVVDLLPYYVAYMEANRTHWKAFFLDFDPHWSPLGHAVAAQAALGGTGFEAQP